MNRSGQAQSIIVFFGLAVSVFIVSIILLRITNEVITPFQAQIGNVSETAGSAVAYTHNRFTAWWDYAIVLLLFMNVILLMVSAFMIDIHPAFLIIYILTILFLFVFGNYALLALDAIWGAIGTTTETAQTPLQQFIINNFQIFMVGIVILSGIVMYAKFKIFPGQGAGGNY